MHMLNIGKGCLKQLTIKTNGKNSRRFDRSSVIIKRNVENMNLHRYIKWHIFATLSLYISMQIHILNISLDNDRRAVETS